MSIYDERQVKGYNPGSGQQQPGKYPYVGPAYQKYGEQPGWTYSPRDDKYYRDQATREGLDEYEQQQGLKEKAPKQPGLLDTVAPVAGTLGAMYLGKTLGQEAIPFIKDTLSSTASSAAPAATQSTPGLLSAAEPTSSALANSGAAQGAFQVGTNADGSILMSDGSSVAAEGAGIGAGTVLGGIAAAKGAYDTVKGFQDGGEGVRSGLTTMGSGIGTMLMPGLGTLGGAAVGNLAGYGLQGKGFKNDLALLGAGSVAGPIGLLAAGGLIGARRLGFDPMQKSTRERTADRTKGLLGASNDVDYQNYVQGMRKQFESAPLDPSKPFAGKYGSFDEYKAAGLEAADLTGVAGNIEAYGPDYAKYTQDQRQAITQANIDLDNYYSEGGDVLIKDKAKAEEARQRALGQQPQVKGAAPTAGTVFDGRPVTKIERTSTRSPGIGLDGKPIRNPGLLGAR